ncbi:1-phosphatidylinositol 3-phosphate 5-kinase-like [Panonychus citri]|uniref:1-phosphatidylinositol 3-phosphate 5-kinase-like n=1 Tax=Panonychus citri TaxID=50023 RepID=UPI002307FE81|nr:1-phosphatidylinositol 3-phosphate 5-kinase-like [Panonychus citri]
MLKKMFYWFGNQPESYKSGLGDLFDFEDGNYLECKNDEESRCSPSFLNQHPLLTRDLKCKLNSGELKDILADFRAHGGCVPKRKVRMIKPNTDFNPEDNLFEVGLPLPRIQMPPLCELSKDNSFSDNSLNVQEPKMMEVFAKEEDPGSIIAYALVSADYEKQLNDIVQGTPTVVTSRKRVLSSIESSTSSGLSEIKDAGQLELSGGFSSVAFTFKASKDTTAISPHIDIQFNDQTTKYYCCVYFAEQFRSLRSELIQINHQNANQTNTSLTPSLSSTSELSQGNVTATSDSSSFYSNATGIDSSSSTTSNALIEETFIRSISCCVPWTASGGKSGATFCKTIDDRFILKEMSRHELASFLKIAKAYFDHVLSAFYESRPTLLAKILGVYRISFKNSYTNNANKMYLLVMENLFYQRNISRRFDLKGSDRNRWVHTDDPTNVVLLDENLLQSLRKSPLYIRPECKQRLTTAIDADSLFLSSHSVMDYSLLVGIDQEQKRLVVGIIDYIRPYTWDKRIEMVVKSVGSHGKMPTIVSPDLYRERFCDKMNQYFLCIPDG